MKPFSFLTPVLSDAQMKEAVEKFTNLLKEQGAEIVNEEKLGIAQISLSYRQEKQQASISWLNSRQIRKLSLLWKFTSVVTNV